MYGRSGLDYIFSSVVSSKPEEEDLDDEVSISIFF